jgi:hypothetical protein
VCGIDDAADRHLAGQGQLHLRRDTLVDGVDRRAGVDAEVDRPLCVDPNRGQEAIVAVADQELQRLVRRKRRAGQPCAERYDCEQGSAGQGHRHKRTSN